MALCSEASISSNVVWQHATVNWARAEPGMAIVRQSSGSQDYRGPGNQLDVCEVRDAEGMHKKVRAGQISEFAGISSSRKFLSSPSSPWKPVSWVLMSVLVRYRVS